MRPLTRLVLLLLLMVPLGACRVTVPLVDEVAEVQELELIYYFSDLEPGDSLRFETRHVSGSAYDVYFVDKENFRALETGRDFTYYTAMSAQGITESFVSGRFEAEDMDTYYVVVTPEVVPDLLVRSTRFSMKIDITH